jgi:hypothetical protein
MLMREKNQKVLDKLFLDQQLINGNSNGEAMAKNGASINNAGFLALPQAVQQKILSNMEYGGFSLPNPLYMQDGAWYTEDQWNAAMGNQNPQSGNWYTEDQWDNAVRGNSTIPVNPEVWYDSNQWDKAMGKSQPSNVSSATNQDNWYTESDWDKAVSGQNFPKTVQPTQSKSSVAPKQATQKAPKRGGKPTLEDTMMDAGRSMTTTPTDAQMQQGIPYAKSLYKTSVTPEGGISPTGKSVYASANSEQDYVAPWIDVIPNVMDMTESEFQSSVYDYALKNDPQSISNMWQEFGLTNLGKADKELFGLTKNGSFDEETLKDPKVLAKLKKAYVDGKLGDRTLKPSQGTTPSGTSNEPDFGRELKPKEASKDKKETKNIPGSTYDGNIDPTRLGRYTRSPYDLTQAIPSVMGLAASQETFPYAIPEVDSPYIRPQTLNIQSQLQDIDNMGQASVRAGADPLGAYIAGIGGKEKSFQTKQNFDAQGRMQADQFNAQAQMQSDRMNAAMFNQVYNQLIPRSRDLAAQEQQAAVANLVKNRAMYNRDESVKEYLHPMYSPTYDYDARTGQATVVPGQPQFAPSMYGLLPPEQLAAQYIRDQQEAQRKKSKQTKSSSTRRK